MTAAPRPGTRLAFIAASAAVVIAAALLAVRTSAYPFLALFAFDAPGAAARPGPWAALIALIAAPWLAVASAVLALTNLFQRSWVLLAIATLLLIVPAAALFAIARPFGAAAPAPARCPPARMQQRAVVEDARCLPHVPRPPPPNAAAR